MGVQPYLSDPEFRSNSRFPQKSFDPKAITRQSWEVKPNKPKPNGPMLSFNRHPDAHMVLNYRSNEFTSMNPRTKAWVKGLRWFQLVLRLLHVVGAAGVVTFFVLLTKVEPTTAWVMRITGGVVMLHGVYAIWHLARNAADRSPGSSAAYSVFAAIIDLTTLVIYAFGAYAIHQNSSRWGVIIPEQKSLVDYFVPAVYYTIIGAGGLHLISFIISLFLGVVFRKISLMPPDMNPLESHLTARPKHKKSKSSFSTQSTTTNEKHMSHDSGVSFGEFSRPPSVPFMHTRTQSRDSNGSRGRVDDLAARYESVYGHSPRASQTSIQQKRQSNYQSSPQRGSYAEVPMGDSGIARPYAQEQRNSSPARAPKFTEAWAPSESMISRTNQRNRYDALNKSRQDMRGKQPYAAVSQRYNLEDSDDSDDSDYENDGGRYDKTDYDDGMHPNPLRSNPSSSELDSASSSPKKGARMQTPFRPRSEDVNQSHDIADQGLSPDRSWKRNTLHVDQLYARPYGDLKSATPPIMVGNNRKVSSGNDFDNTNRQNGMFGRRNVSGKVAEEGRANKDRASHYGFFSGR